MSTVELKTDPFAARDTFNTGIGKAIRSCCTSASTGSGSTAGPG